MKKHIKTKRFNRDSQHRKALFQNLVNSMIEHEEISTTSAKARAVRGIFEKLITKGRLGTVHATRQIHDFVQDRTLVHKLVHKISPRYMGVKGGYTKLTMIGNRRGDNALMVRLSLTKKKITVGAKPSRSFSKKIVKKSIGARSSRPTKPSAKPTKSSRPTTSTKQTTHVRKQGDR